MGYEVEYGARPLRRSTGRQVEDVLALQMVTRELHGGDTVRVDVVKGELVRCIEPTANRPTVEVLS